MALQSKQVSRETPVAPTPAPPKPARAAMYLVKDRVTWTRNGVMIDLQPGKVIRYDKEPGLIEEALELKGHLIPVSDADLFTCPHCHKVSSLK